MGLFDRDWRLVWDEVLDESARRRIRRATWRGEALSDPGEAAVAVERAARLRRGLIWRVVVNIIALLLLIAVALSLVELPSTPWFWWLVGTYCVLLLAVPVLGWLRRRQLDRAIAANSRHET